MTNQCTECKNANPISGGCKAYPKGVPYKFSSDEEKHTKVEPDQKGDFVFDKGEPEELKEITGKG